MFGDWRFPKFHQEVFTYSLVEKREGGAEKEVLFCIQWQQQAEVSPQPGGWPYRKWIEVGANLSLLTKEINRKFGTIWIKCHSACVGLGLRKTWKSCFSALHLLRRKIQTLDAPATNRRSNGRPNTESTIIGFLGARDMSYVSQCGKWLIFTTSKLYKMTAYTNLILIIPTDKLIEN